MKKDLQPLPISIQSFKKLREDNFLYVDKTKDILNLVSTRGSYFLSRPRRFGKSLLLNTLESLFKGEKELFKDLYIYDKWDWNETYPVLKFDFTGMDHGSIKQFEKSLNRYLDSIAKKFNVSIEDDLINSKFRDLIEKIFQLTKKRVVVLIDEYDAAILDNIDDLNLREANKKILSRFYKVLKTDDEFIHFVFITGVSKFVGTSIFSGFNSPDDITLDERFSTICGYTHQELENYFYPYFEEICKNYGYTKEELINNIKKEYDGYSWDGKISLYNPQSTLQLFRKKEFNNYWFASGTPNFLLELIKKNNELEPLTNEVTISDNDLLNSFELDDIDLVPLLFQSGYLTIKSKIYNGNSIEYILTIPNLEVRNSLYTRVFKVYTNYSFRKINSLIKTIYNQIVNEDSDALEKSISEMLSPVSHLIVDKHENYYHSLFTLWLSLQGFNITTEKHSHTSRIDATLRLDNKIILCELKHSFDEKDLGSNLDLALNQIEDKKYYEKFINKYDIAFLGISFAAKKVKCKFKKFKKI